MSGSPWLGVLSIAASVGIGLLGLLMILKADGLRSALTRRFRLPLLLGFAILGLGLSVLIVRNGTGSGAALAFLLAAGLFDIANGPRAIWARMLLWLDGALLAAVTIWSWRDLRGFGRDDLSSQVVTLLLIGFVLYAAGTSLLRIFRPRAEQPPSTPSAETGTPA